jgi:hydroxyacylglutathione hydrolase
MHIRTLETPDLGNRSYVIDDGTISIVIDPPRDLDRLEAILEHDPAYVLETHLHNDYVTGGFELARRTGATYGVNAADEVGFDRLPLSDGQLMLAGDLAITVFATPGHTPTHLAYLARNLADPLAPPALFSGGSLLKRTVGRTDLIDPARTRTLASDQYRSTQMLSELPDDTALYPTHGFGSFCASGTGSTIGCSTIGEERATNPFLLTDDIDEFVGALVASFGPYPAYYRHVAPINRNGPGAPPSGPVQRATQARIQELLDRGTLIDVRRADEFSAQHLARSLSLPLGDQFATYAGWLTPWGEPLGLVGTTPDQIIGARRRLSRIGLDDLVTSWGLLDEVAPGAPQGTLRRATFDDLASERRGGDVVLDVRRPEEYADAHLAGAMNLPVHEIAARHHELARDSRTWVYCASGYRAGAAASLLQREGVDAVHLDDSFERAVAIGLTASPARDGLALV